MLRPPARLRPCPDTACSGQDSLRLGTVSPVSSSPPSPVDTRQALLVPLLAQEPSAAGAGDPRQGRGAAASLLWALPKAHVDSSGSCSPLSYVGLPEPQPCGPAPPSRTVPSPLCSHAAFSPPPGRGTIPRAEEEETGAPGLALLVPSRGHWGDLSWWERACPQRAGQGDGGGQATPAGVAKAERLLCAGPWGSGSEYVDGQGLTGLRFGRETNSKTDEEVFRQGFREEG